MLRILRFILLLALVSMASPRAFAFALLGPYATNQTERIGYNVHGFDIGGVMQRDEGYRWNVPIVTYAFDSSFIQYFGENGVKAVTQAMELFNKYTTNLDKMTDADLKKVPLDTTRFNYQAQALGIDDLKSYVLGYLMEEMGMASPDRYVWCLRNRQTFTDPNYTNYVVIQRNFDPVTLNPSSYVNGTLYTYTIYDRLLRDPDVADALEVPVDPLRRETAIASTIDNIVTVGTQQPGRFFTGLTRDDVGGLRFLVGPSTLREETLPNSGTVTAELAVTNFLALQLVTTSNMVDLVSNTWHTTNTSAQVLAIYPNLNLTSTNYYLTNMRTTNYVYYYTNMPFTPADQPPTLVSNAVYTTNATITYDYGFDNVVTNRYAPFSLVSVQTTKVGMQPWTPVGVIGTNVSRQTYLTNLPAGDFYIIPPTNQNYVLVTNMLTTITINTNTLTLMTNYVTNSFNTNSTSTNTDLSSNTFLVSTQVDLVTYFTNSTFAMYPIEWRSDTNTAGLRPGVGHIKFQRVDFDSIIGQVFTPTTNFFTDTVITNGIKIKRTVRLRATQPDILFVAEDLGLTDDGYPVTSRRTDTTAWQNNTALNRAGSGAGPGNIFGPISLRFSNIGSWQINETPSFLTEATSFRGFAWGSFDGSTNAPVVYPDDGRQTLEYLERIILESGAKQGQ
jgi:hypothetical protein